MLVINPFTRQVLNANPEGCNQYTGKGCKHASEMTEPEFTETFGIHSTDKPNEFEPEDRYLEVTRPGQKRFFKHLPAVVVRDKRGKRLEGEHYAAALSGKNAEVVSRDPAEVAAYEQGYKSLMDYLKRR